MASSECTDRITSYLNSAGITLNLYKAGTIFYVGLNIFFGVWLTIHLLNTKKMLSKFNTPINLFTIQMATVLFLYFLLNIITGAIMFFGLKPVTGAYTFSQKMVISNCGLGENMIDSVALFCLWTAAILVGVKYKKTALRIHAAVFEANIEK